MRRTSRVAQMAQAFLCRQAFSAPMINLTVPAQAVTCQTAVAMARYLSSTPMLSSGLQALLQNELKHEQTTYETPEQIAGGPPAPFILSEAPGDTMLTLTRTHGNEKISVDLHVNNQPGPVEQDSEDKDSEDEDSTLLSTVVFNVHVEKGNESLPDVWEPPQIKAPILKVNLGNKGGGAPLGNQDAKGHTYVGGLKVFECESDGTFVAINHVSQEPKDGALDSESWYSGPVFDELDDGVQRAFRQYIEERGITPDLGEYLRHLVFDKESREYQNWLQRVASFVAK